MLRDQARLAAGVIPPNTAKLGPVVSAEWQWRMGSARFRELAQDRPRRTERPR